MTPRPALLLLALASAASPGCMAVYAPAGLPDEYRADATGLEGLWTLAEPGKPAVTISVARTGPGAYAASLAGPGPGVSSEGRLRTFAVGGRTFALVEGTTTDPEHGTTATPFPAVIKLAVAANRVDVWQLKPGFLKANPAAPPFRPAAAPDAGRDDEVVVTATPRQLAEFLAAVADDPRAWLPMTEGTAAITRADSPAGRPDWGARFRGWVPEQAPAAPARRSGPVSWLSERKWLVLGAVLLGSWLVGHAVRKFSTPPADPGPAAPAGTRRAWVDAVVRLLVLSVRTARADQALRAPERALIAAVAAAEARRADAPGDAAPMTKGEVERLVRGYEGDCPGVVELFAFLAEPANAGLRTRLLKRVWQAAVCDGPATAAEAESARSYAAETGVSEAEFSSVSLRYFRPAPPEDVLDEARALLHVPRTATAEEVKKAYKRKAREYHPDAHAGAAETLKQLAAERFSRLGEAKRTLLAGLGGGPLVARSASGGLVPAGDRPAEVRCFGCGAARPGVAADAAYQARCPKCLTLLYHEPAFAAELLREGVSEANSKS